MASFDKAIPPGQEGKVTLKVNTKNKKGKFSQTAAIISNDPQNPSTKISLSGLIKQFISVDPGARLKLQGFYGDKIKKEVTITSLEEQPFKITGITSNIEALIEYELKTIQENKSYNLEIKTRSGIKEPFQGKVVLKTNSQKKPEIEISLEGRVREEVRVSPRYVFFGVIDTSKEDIDPSSLIRRITVDRFREGNLTVEKVETSRDWIRAKWGTFTKDKKHIITISLDRNKLPKGNFREKVTIHTKDNIKSGVSTVIVEAKVI